jgi:hypothetical protein
MCAPSVNILSHRISPVVIPQFLVQWFISQVAAMQRERLFPVALSEVRHSDTA